MPTFGSYDYLTLQGRQPRSRYGYDGNGIFCTVSCGYRWAVRRVRQEIDDE